MKKYVFNDNATIIFLKDSNYLLGKIDEVNIKLKLELEEKNTLINSFKENSEIVIKDNTHNIKELISKGFLVEIKEDNPYLNTKLERSNQYFIDMYCKDCIKLLKNRKIMIIRSWRSRNRNYKAVISIRNI